MTGHSRKGAHADATRVLKPQDGGALLRGQRLSGDDARASALNVAQSTYTPVGVLIIGHVRSDDEPTARW